MQSAALSVEVTSSESWSTLPKWLSCFKNLYDIGPLVATKSYQSLSVEESLAHKYLSAYYDPSDEPVAEKPFTFEMEFDELPTRQLKEMIYREAVEFKIAQLTETSLWGYPPEVNNSGRKMMKNLIQNKHVYFSFDAFEQK